ncbi:unnamed protein product, partial [Ectocarpus sp. 8 AP-2014]
MGVCCKPPVALSSRSPLVAAACARLRLGLPIAASFTGAKVVSSLCSRGSHVFHPHHRVLMMGVSRTPACTPTAVKAEGCNDAPSTCRHVRRVFVCCFCRLRGVSKLSLCLDAYSRRWCCRHRLVGGSDGYGARANIMEFLP